MKSGIAALVFVGVFTWAFQVQARDVGFDTPPLDFSLHLTRDEASLRNGAARIPITVTRVGVTAYRNADPSLQPGLLLGYASVDGADWESGAREPEGFYAGPALRSTILAGSRLSATLGGVYLYQRVRDEHAGASNILEWRQWQLALDLLWQASPRIGLLLGAHYEGVEADQRLSGTPNRPRSLSHAPEAGGRLGLEFTLGGDGRIGITSRQGLFDGLNIYFQRQF